MISKNSNKPVLHLVSAHIGLYLFGADNKRLHRVLGPAIISPKGIFIDLTDPSGIK